MTTKFIIDRERALKSVGPGWSNLINELYDKLPEECVVVQVKEKYGGLRFYVNNSTREFEDLIDKMEDESYNLCEECGINIDVSTVAINGWGWIKTLCQFCRLHRE